MADGVHLTEQDKAEAACVTARGGGHQYEIQLGHLCNNRCVFCSSGQLTELKLARHVPLAPIVHAIEKARADGARRITFLGGEPTLHKGFPEAVKRAVELAFEEIVIFTNGVLLPHPGFIEKIASLGRFEWRVSIQGGNEAAHVAVTKRKDSFRRIVDGVRMLRARGEKVTANMCVNEESYRSLPDYPSLAVELGLSQLHVDIIRPSSAGERDGAYLREIMPRYSLMAPFMASMLDGFDRVLPGFDVHVGNLPFCVLPTHAHRIEHGGEETITEASDATGLEVAVDEYEWHRSMRRHLPSCEACAFRPKCTGIFGTYLELYGDDEFQPVSHETLRAIDRDGRHFTLLVEPMVQALERAEASDVVRVESIARDSRERRVDFVIALGSGELRLTLAPAGALGDGASLVAEQFELGVDAAPEVTPTDLARALEWMDRTLRAAPQTRIVRPLDATRIVAGHRRARVLPLLAREVRRLGPFDDFEVVDARVVDEGVSIDLVGPEGATLDVRFASRERAGRRGLSVSARPGATVGASRTRAIVNRLARAVREDAVLRDALV